MKLTPNSFFPYYKFHRINLNTWYLQNKESISDTKDPEQIQRVLNRTGKYFTYGGYGEDRKDIWKGTYLDETKGYIHLGIDINVPKGLTVSCPFDAEIVDKFFDVDTQIGWGGRLMLKVGKNKALVVLAHLNPSSLPKHDFIEAGEEIGQVGDWPFNGNTFQHLHVQCITHRNFYSFDGYGFKSDLTNNPNPFKIDFQ